MNFDTARANMVDNQVRTTDVTSHSVLTAFLTVPREAFVPEKSKTLAYVDNDVEICPAANGQPARYLMQPSPLAKLLQLAEIRKDDVVLEVGCGTGYVSAILSMLAGSVVALEQNEELAATAKTNLSSYPNVSVATGALNAGNTTGAPYDLIFVNGAVEELPQALLSQLRDGGRLVTVHGQGGSARATVLSSERGAISENVYFNASVKPLPGFAKAREFVF
ncbi:protein-L-isoaspartate O-methyltransferase [Rhizobium grahamii]|uniref:Protein-L-isoaspartate O-methyltransferase n=1 Tax=Rhizobium grahamii TaxID=1120045 RepID=A0A5Q0C3B6_9HYPH|nr:MULTISPECIES: protein-L-isoaspartate O-methyltransferase [Rhizobium]QFY59933.1 protein-L-isoaspartate O-methyltransferase [Rhizobium grahamii]QRM50950.1 protein-L-isoaspartate O-methyltransferase [Rhizobium sp. BG6]